MLATDTSIRQIADRIKQIVGDANVQTSDEQRRAHSRDTSTWQRVCSIVAYPSSTEEVAEIVRVAAEHNLPVWTFSGGKNWGYGATMAFREGAIVLMLHRMNRIIEVNEELAYAVLEPGVTQKQLNDHLKATGSKLWADVTDSSPQGSIIGNALERGVGYTPYWDHFAYLCGMEVVLGTGEVIRTGGGPEKSRTWHTHKWGSGPYTEGLFSQSNFGIVTKAGVWLMPEPEAFNFFTCEIKDAHDQPAALDTIRQLALQGVMHSNIHMVNDVLFMAQMMPYPYRYLDGKTYLSNEARARLRERYKLTPWTVVGGIYGTKSRVKADRTRIKKEMSRFGKVTVLDDRKFGLARGALSLWKRGKRLPFVNALFQRVTGASLEKLEGMPQVYPILKGIPGEHVLGFAYFKYKKPRPKKDLDPARDGAGLIWLAVTLPLSGKHALELHNLCEPIFNKHGFDLSYSLMMLNPRSALALMQIFYDKDSPEESVRADALYDEITRATAEAGFQQYRTSVAYSDRILSPAPEFGRFVNAMKEAVDPSNVIAPGRYGIGL